MLTRENIFSKKKKKIVRGPEFEVVRTDGTVKGKRAFDQKDNKAAKKFTSKKKDFSQKKDGAVKKDYNNKKDSSQKKEDLSNSQKRHQRNKVSDMVKKLRVSAVFTSIVELQQITYVKERN